MARCPTTASLSAELQEARLNELDHFRATIDGLRIHFVHAPAERTDALPVLLLHGWPGSFLQMQRIIPS